MEGTHPRLGEDSQVRLLCGQTPVIKMIRDYSLNQPQLCRELEKVDDQINQILRLETGIFHLSIISLLSSRLCRIRSIFLEIANIERQPLWAIGRINHLSPIQLIIVDYYSH